MRCLSTLIAACLAVHAQADTVRLDGKTPEERGAAMVRYVAGVKPDPKSETYPKAAAPCYAARLVLNVDTAYALAKLDAAAAHQLARGRGRIAEQAAYDAAKDKTTLKRPGPALDPFDKAALVNTYFLGKDKIPKATALKIRDYVALYDDHKALTGYARGAWNYKLMMDASGFLAAEEWPELVDRAGQNADTNQGGHQGAPVRRLRGDHDEKLQRIRSHHLPGSQPLRHPDAGGVRPGSGNARARDPHARCHDARHRLHLEPRLQRRHRLAREVLGLHRHRPRQHGVHRRRGLGLLRRAPPDLCGAASATSTRSGWPRPGATRCRTSS